MTKRVLTLCAWGGPAALVIAMTTYSVFLVVMGLSLRTAIKESTDLEPVPVAVATA